MYQRNLILFQAMMKVRARQVTTALGAGRRRSTSSKSGPLYAEKHDTIPGLGYLSFQKGGSSRYVGQTFWTYVGDDVR